MVQGVFVLLLFFFFAFLMITNRLPVALALPIYAVCVTLIVGAPFIGVDAEGANIGILATVVESGVTFMAGAVVAVVFGAWMGQMLIKTGMSALMIKKAAELGGDRPLIITFLLCGVVVVLSTAITGTGAVIMMGTVVLPIFISLGIPKLMAGCLFLMAYAAGSCMMPSNWEAYSRLMQLPVEDIAFYCTIVGIITIIAMIVFILVEFKRNGVKYAFSAPTGQAEETIETVTGFRCAMAALTPIIPLILVAVLGLPVVSSIAVGIIWIAIWTARGYMKTINTVIKACFDGIADTAPAIIILMVLGILLNGVTHPMVVPVITPVMGAITPANAVTFLLIFGLISPLTLYRGPLATFGLGAGIAAVLLGMGILPPHVIMVGFYCRLGFSIACDPTATQLIWTGNYVGEDPASFMKRQIPYLWIASVIGAVVGIFIYT